ncbi:hypothetical protein DPMN_118642 [Dreissena polymorpha]|uniref:Uncharacterized protein n=1 Tax=Dreissena polymorpha TaxID=45954 RepID=A0A9D4JQF4_DREPO|nr:hypothetical protein DPMN_118642 [Dreissena polymorpha]
MMLVSPSSMSSLSRSANTDATLIGCSGTSRSTRRISSFCGTDHICSQKQDQEYITTL